jgi:carboxyl-terminal processing protease
VPKGKVVYTKDKNGKEEDYYSDDEKQLKIPTVVLVNGGTASSSEIFTGAIRDFKWGTIIGENTFGKGIVQITLPLSDGSAIKVTNAKYYTPNGECIHKKGIKPDIDLKYQFLGNENDEYDYTLDNQIQKALEVLKK